MFFNESILNNMGIRFVELHIFNYVIVAFDKAIKINLKNPYSWIGEGVALLKLNKVNEAFEAFNRESYQD